MIRWLIGVFSLINSEHLKKKVLNKVFKGKRLREKAEFYHRKIFQWMGHLCGNNIQEITV